MELIYNTITTKEDYLYDTGIDLDVELTTLVNNDLGDSPSSRFIYGIEKWLITRFTTLPYSWNGEFVDEKQEKLFKYAVISQIQYVLQNGSINNDSGFNQASSILISRDNLNKIAVGQDAMMYLRKAGIANLMRW